MTVAQSKPRFQHASEELRLINPSRLDLRDEKDIIDEITSVRPIVGTKNVWAFWDKGWDKLSPWKKRNVVSWARRLGKDWEIRVLDTVAGSPHHVANFVPAGLLPTAILENKMTGRFSGQHSADHARMAILITHGGVWLDIAFILLRHLDDICWRAINDSQDPHELCLIRNVQGDLLHSILLNNFVAALPANPFLIAWHKIFLELWKGRDTCTGISNTPLFDHIMKFQTSPVWKALFGPGATTEYLNDYFTAAVCSSRLCSIEDPVTGFSGVDYFRKHIRLFDMSEIYPKHSFCVGDDGFDEFQHMELMSLPRSEPINRNDSQQVRAEQLVEGVLTKGFVKALSQGPWDPSIPNMAKQWTAEIDADVRPGTWAEYFRWGVDHLEQTRELRVVPGDQIEKTAALGGTQRKVWRVGLLDPIRLDVTEVVEG